ncbi:MAG: metallophosphoesterase [Sphingomicrobium sp.]
MIRRWTVIVAAMLAALGHAVPLPAQTANERIVAVGDLHGDYSAWLTIARASRLVGTDNKWAAGKTIFVQTGDVTDRGPDSLKIIRHLQELEREARAAGGKVIVLLGNHEAMQVTGDLRYVHPGEYAAFANRQSGRRRAAAFEANKERISEYFLARDPSLSPEAIEAEWLKETPLGKVEHDTAWSPKGDLGQWAARLPAVVKVGDTLFAHGGINGQYALVPMVEINRRAKAAIEAGDASPEAIINDENGPLWYRGLANETGSGGRTAENELDAALKVTGTKRLVVGHTPKKGAPRFALNGKLVLIDTAISSYYGGSLGWIEIVGDRVTPHVTERRP